MTTQTKRHMNKCAQVEEQFFQILEDHPTLYRLAEFTTEGSILEPKRVFYSKLAGPKDEVKHRLLNICLLVFAEKLCKPNVPKKQLEMAKTEEEREQMTMYQPNSLGTMHRQLFAQF